MQGYGARGRRRIRTTIDIRSGDYVSADYGITSGKSLEGKFLNRKEGGLGKRTGGEEGCDDAAERIVECEGRGSGWQDTLKGEK